ncbi:sodium channel protein Nach-like isoform X2 [Daktulosphaira vitifoliae]|uniref:sodium channel protein Nach-like isoform X2 n=1 Tax=Daktulosphaira vitifoliae TaxID=58002 RepID=UPI0021A9916E|nr:sodium channel protein Nach-like isoform X2 [Daktulosphaira vitifoliae]
MQTIQRKRINNNSNEKKLWNPLKKSLLYLKEFSEITSLHGIRHIGLSNRHVLEVALWLLCVIMSVYGSIALMINSYERYNTNPTVITVEKNYRYWYIQFPSATFCYADPINKDLAKEYIKEKWNVSSGEEFDYYMKFITEAVNVTYESLNLMIPYSKNPKLNKINLKELSDRVHVELRFKSSIFNTEYQNISFEPVLTEMGTCYTFSGTITEYFRPNGKIQIKRNYSPPSCNFFNSLCYARAESLSRIVAYYVHYARELPNIVDKYFLVVDNMERDTTFTFWEMTSAQELRKLSPVQRQCRYMDEPMDRSFPVYSYNICRMICRRNLAIKYCGCTPHFYLNRDNSKICDLEGLACLSPYNETLITLQNTDGSQIWCNCLMPCEDSKLFLDRDSKRTWSYPVPYDIRFRWAIDKYSKTRLRRDVIYSFEDLLELLIRNNKGYRS